MTLLSPRSAVASDELRLPMSPRGNRGPFAASRQRQTLQPKSAAVTVGLGDPVTDVIVRVSEDELTSLIKERTAGGCDMVNHTECSSLLAKLSQLDRSMATRPGGSAANVMRCAARLAPSGTFRFAGRRQAARLLPSPGRRALACNYACACSAAPPICVPIRAGYGTCLHRTASQRLHAALSKRNALTRCMHAVPCRFCGGAAADQVAEGYRAELEHHSVEVCLVQPPAAAAHEPSALSVCMITPDGQRTMRTCLGAAAHLTADNLPVSAIATCSLLHCEGYVLFKADLLQAALHIAKQSGAQVSLDLASLEVVRACWPQLQSTLQSGAVDIAFCNEDEALELGKLVLQAGLIPQGVLPSSMRGKANWCSKPTLNVLPSSMRGKADVVGRNAYGDTGIEQCAYICMVCTDFSIDLQ